MKTLKYLSKKIKDLKNLKAPTKSDVATTSIFELSNQLYEENFEEVSADDKSTNILLSQMYSKEDEALFI